MNKNAVEIKALIEGLNAALSLELKRVQFLTDYIPLYQFLYSLKLIKLSLHLILAQVTDSGDIEEGSLYYTGLAYHDAYDKSNRIKIRRTDQRLKRNEVSLGS
ncbi:hypothetical protein Dsin_020116 [Dipteronia sinensis]|uniref:RNase H type-1 domain-containing protein n=1 Tax=Dipteronia sinensis TaxID=43782 RepID=A0AAE0A8L4_9ROSI|nr:hypothetical protein Dsin_020116 [Dipteronia sinensis]